MKPYKYRIFIILFVTSLILHACVKNYFEFDKISTDMEWDPSLAVPLINTTMGISDILRDTGAISFLEVDSENLFSIVYSQDLFSQTAEEFIDIQDQNYYEIFTNSDYDLAGGFNNDSVVMIKDNVRFPFSVAVTQVIDSMFIESAIMRIQVSSSFNHTGVLEISFPSMTLDGEPFEKRIEIDNSNGNFSSDQTYNEFENYFVDLSNFGITSNSFFVNYKLTLYDAGTGNIQSNDNAIVNIDFTDIEYKYLFGFFGNMEQSIPADSFAISAFENIAEANAGLADPQFTLSVNNSFGIPIRFGFEQFATYSNITQTYTNLDGDSIPRFSNDIAPFYIRNPEYVNLQEINPITSERTFTREGTNIVEVFSTLPKLISYEFGYILNPEELAAEQNNFIAGNSSLDISFGMEIPLFGYAEYAGLRDTIPLELSGMLGSNMEIEMALIKFEINNGLPVDVLLQGYFLDDLNNPPLDSLFNNSYDQALIDAGALDDNFRVNQETGKTAKSPEIILNKEKFENIENTKYLILWFNVRTADYQNQTPVKFYSEYTIDIKMGIQIQGSPKF
jgi:hypothetical protein